MGCHKHNTTERFRGMKSEAKSTLALAVMSEWKSRKRLLTNALCVDWQLRMRAYSERDVEAQRTTGPFRTRTQTVTAAARSAIRFCRPAARQLLPVAFGGHSMSSPLMSALQPARL